MEKIAGVPMYSIALDPGQIVVKARQATPFVRLTKLPSALGTREGSNDHLQHKSKHN